MEKQQQDLNLEFNKEQHLNLYIWRVSAQAGPAASFSRLGTKL